MNLWNVTVICLFCVVRCSSSRLLKVPFNYLSESSVLSRQCLDLQEYPLIKLVGGPCVDQNTLKYGILRAEKQCHYNVSGVTPSSLGYACCESIVCCPNPDPPTTIREQYCHAVQDFAFQEQITLYRETLMPVKLNPNVCGEIKIPNGLNDEFVKKNEFPFMAELRNKSRIIIKWTPGVLISDQYILTVADKINELTVARLGTFNSLEDVNTVYVNIIEQIPHPNYLDGKSYNNIGLVKLESAIEFNTYIRSACLSTGSAFLDSALILGHDFSVRSTYDILKKSTITVPNMYTCRNRFENHERLKKGIDNQTQICLKTDTCLQSGVCVAVNYNNHEAFDIIGIYSIQMISSCSIGLFTRVAPYVDWIESIAWK